MHKLRECADGGRSEAWSQFLTFLTLALNLLDTARLAPVCYNE